MIRNIFIALLSFAVVGCALPSAMSNANNLTSSGSQVVIIGKFEVTPPIDPELEQTTHWNVIGDGQMINRIAMATGSTSSPINTNQIKFKDWNNYIHAEWGIPFVLKAPRERVYLRGGMMQLDVVSQDKLWFPGGYYFEAPENASAIYIGTLRYHRNDFNRITRIEVIDEQIETLSALRDSFGNTHTVIKSLLKKAD